MQEIATFFGLLRALMAMPTVTEARRRALFRQCPLMQFMPGAVVVPRPKRGQKRAAPPYLVHGAAGAAEDVTSRDVWAVRDAAKRSNPGAESDRRGVPRFLHPADVAVKRARASEDTGTQRIEGVASPRKALVRTETASSIAAAEQAAAAEIAPLPKGKGTPKVRRRQALLPKDLLQTLKRDFVEACMSHGLSSDHLTVLRRLRNQATGSWSHTHQTLLSQGTKGVAKTKSLTTEGKRWLQALRRKAEVSGFLRNFVMQPATPRLVLAPDVDEALDIMMSWNRESKYMICDFMEEPLLAAVSRLLINGVSVSPSTCRVALKTVSENFSDLSAEQVQYCATVAETASDSTFLRWLRRQDWTWTSAGTGGELIDPQWRAHADLMFARHWRCIVELSIPPACVINADESFLSVITSHTHSWSPVAFKFTPIGSSVKYGMTGTPVITAAGQLIGYQLLVDRAVSMGDLPTEADVREMARKAWGGAANSPDAPAVAESFKWDIHTGLQSKWQTPQTLRGLVENIIVPSRGTSQVLLKLDVASSHIDKSFRTWLQENHPNIHLRFVPSNCTSKLQALDVGVQRPIKDSLRRQARDAAADLLLSSKQGLPDEDYERIKSFLALPSLLRHTIKQWLPRALVGVSRKTVLGAWDGIRNHLSDDPVESRLRLCYLDVWGAAWGTEAHSLGTWIQDKLQASRHIPAFHAWSSMRKCLARVPAELKHHYCASLPIGQLIVALKGAGLKCSGNKTELIMRCVAAGVLGGDSFPEVEPLSVSPGWSKLDTALTSEEDDMIEAANVQTESFRQHLRLCIQRVHTMPAVKGGVLVPAASLRELAAAHLE